MYGTSSSKYMEIKKRIQCRPSPSNYFSSPLEKSTHNKCIMHARLLYGVVRYKFCLVHLVSSRKSICLRLILSISKDHKAVAGEWVLILCGLNNDNRRNLWNEHYSQILLHVSRSLSMLLEYTTLGYPSSCASTVFVCSQTLLSLRVRNNRLMVWAVELR